MTLLEFVHSGRIAMTWNRNEVGKLWERMWRWTNEHGYETKVCAPGCYGDWHRYSSAEEFVLAFNLNRKEFFGDHYDDEPVTGRERP